MCLPPRQCPLRPRLHLRMYVGKQLRVVPRASRRRNPVVHRPQRPHIRRHRVPAPLVHPHQPLLVALQPPRTEHFFHRHRRPLPARKAGIRVQRALVRVHRRILLLLLQSLDHRLHVSRQVGCSRCRERANLRGNVPRSRSRAKRFRLTNLRRQALLWGNNLPLFSILLHCIHKSIMFFSHHAMWSQNNGTEIRMFVKTR